MNRTMYMLMHLSFAAICFFAFQLLNLNFQDSIFFLLSYLWSFTLLTPGLRDQILKKKNSYSFTSIVFRTNHYLQMLTLSYEKKIPEYLRKYRNAFTRFLSPFIFALILMLMGGDGSLVFLVLGIVFFELVQLLFKNVHARFVK